MTQISTLVSAMTELIIFIRLLYAALLPFSPSVEVDYLLTKQCSTPCYYNLIPGKARIHEVLFALPHILINDKASEIELTFIDSNLIISWKNNALSRRLIFVLSKNFLRQIIIKPQKTFNLEQAIRIYGEPSHSLISYHPPSSWTSVVPPVYSRLQIDYINPENGVVMYYDEFILDVYGVTAICEDDPIYMIVFYPTTRQIDTFLAEEYDFSQASIENYLQLRAPYTGEEGWRGFTSRLALARDTADITRIAGYDQLLCEIKRRKDHR
jgi:hypothetical protein